MSVNLTGVNLMSANFMGSNLSGRTAEIVRFLIVGGVTFIIDWGLLFILTETTPIGYLWASAIAFIIAVIINYILCVKFVFDTRGDDGKTKQIGGVAKFVFIASSVAGLIINQICMFVFVEWCGIHYTLAKVLATIIVTAWNYTLKRRAIVNDHTK